MTQQEKIIERVRKLLALANDAGATEAEASLAATKAAEIMEEHGLEVAAVELAGGQGEKRDMSVTGVAGLGREAWALRLMEAVAQSCFCDAQPVRGFHGRKLRLTGFSIIGRHSAVISCKQLYEYLSRTTIRLSRKEEGSERYFRFGCAERLSERLTVRYNHRMAEQRREAEAKQEEMRSRSTGSKAVAVVLENYAESEHDLNEDHRRNLPAGTTKARRVEAELRAQERDDAIARLTAEGISWDIAWWMANGKTKEEAEAIEAKANSASEKKTRFRFRDYVDFDARRREHSSYRAGRNAGDSIGIDDQVTNGNHRRIK